MRIIEDFITQESATSSFHEGNSIRGILTRPNKSQYKYEFIFDVAGAGTGSEWESGVNDLRIDPSGHLSGELSISPGHYKRAIQLVINEQMFPGKTVGLHRDSHEKFGFEMIAKDFDITSILNEGQLDELQENEVAARQITRSISDFPQKLNLGNNLQFKTKDLHPLDYDIQTYDFDNLDDYANREGDEFYDQLEDELENISEELEEDDRGLASIDVKINLAIRIKKVK